MQLREDLLLPIQLVVELVIAVCRGEECVAVGDEEIENAHHLQWQMEYIALLDQRLLLIHQKT